MRIKMKRFLGILLKLALVLGLMPGMSLTAYAATSHGITINTAQHGTVTASVNGSAATSAEEGAPVTLTANPDNGYRLKTISGTYQVVNPQETKGLNGTKTINGTYFNLNATDAAGAGWKLANNSTITITSKDSSVKIDKVDFNIVQRGNSFNLNNVSCSAGTKSLNGNTLSVSSINGTTVTLSSSVNNAGYVRFNSVTIYGTGAVDTNLTISTTDNENVRTFTMPVVVDGNVSITAEFEAHTHNFTYSASEATITATCGGSGTCDITEGLTLTISAPTGNLVYDGTTTYPATLSTGYNTTAFPGTYSISYTKDGSAYSGVPKDAGTYTASVTAGTGDAAKTASVSYTVTKAAATVTKAPAAKTLTYNGEAQELVTAGTAESGEMQYALGTATEATQPYTTSIPKGTEAGTYYVWYKAKGDNSHSDSKPGVVSVTIKEKSDPHEHDIKKMDAKEPTCTEDGYKAHYECTECGKWFEDANGSSEITDKSSFIINAIGHKWDDGVVTKEATYDETGIKTFTCENDPSHTKEEEIPRKVYYERESDTDNSDGSSGSSGGGSSKNSGSVSKQSIDVNGNTISSNHQAETGVPASDVGGRWANSANADIWTYTKSDGTLAKSEWMSLDYNGLRYWYYFNEDGIMLTNWFDYNGERFYLMPEKDGWRGRMATGWKNIDNKWYYFDIVPGSTQGKLYRGSVTPDGHVVGADGAWNGVGETPVGQE